MCFCFINGCMSKTKEKIKNKGRKGQKDFDRILEFLFDGQNGLEKIRMYQDEEREAPKKRWFFAG